MARLVKRFSGGSKVAEELSYMADVLNALLKMTVEGGEFAIKPGVGATLNITQDDLIRIAKMTSDLAEPADGRVAPEEGTAKLLIPGRGSVLEELEDPIGIEVSQRFGFSLATDDITLLVRDLRTGEWWPIGGGGGGGGESLIAEFYEFPTAYDECYDPYDPCAWWWGTVVHGPCSGSPAIGDQIPFWDLLGCKISSFARADLEEDALDGYPLRFWAHKVKKTSGPYEEAYDSCDGCVWAIGETCCAELQ